MMKINLSNDNNRVIVPNQVAYDKYIPLRKQFTAKELRLAILKGANERRMRGK